MATLPDDVRDLLDGPNFVHVASTLPDGAPHVVAIWAGVERGPDGDRIVFFTGPGTRKASNLDRDGRVAFSVVGHDDPYRTAWVRGRVVEKRIDDLETMDHLSHVYTGAPFPNRTNVVYVVEPERWKYLHLPSATSRAPDGPGGGRTAPPDQRAPDVQRAARRGAGRGAVGWLASAEPATALDLGCGTGRAPAAHRRGDAREPARASTWTRRRWSWRARVRRSGTSPRA